MRPPGRLRRFPRLPLTEHSRNVACVAHLERTKTVRVDRPLQQAGGLGHRTALRERLLDANAHERRRAPRAAVP